MTWRYDAVRMATSPTMTMLIRMEYCRAAVPARTRTRRISSVAYASEDRGYGEKIVSGTGFDCRSWTACLVVRGWPSNQRLSHIFVLRPDVRRLAWLGLDKQFRPRPAPGAEQRVQNRQHDQDQHGGRDHPPDDDARERLLGLRTDAGRHRRRQQPDRRPERGHEDGPHWRFERGNDRVVTRDPFPEQLINAGNQQHAAKDRHTQQGDDPHRRGDTEVRPGQNQRQHASDQRKRDRGQNQESVAEGVERHIQQEQDHEQTHRHDDGQAPLFILKLIILPCDLVPQAWRHRNFLLDARQRFADRPFQVASSDAELDRNVPFVVLAINDEGPGLGRDLRKLLQGDPRPIRRADLDLADRLKILAVLGQKAHDQVEPPLAFQDLRDGLSSDRRLHDRVHIPHQHTLASAGVPLHFDHGLGLTKQFEHAQVFDAGDGFYLPLNLKRRTLELREVSAEQFDGVLTLHPGHGLLHIVLDDLREIECDSRKGLELVFDLPDNPRFVKTGGPLLTRLEVH